MRNIEKSAINAGLELAPGAGVEALDREVPKRFPRIEIGADAIDQALNGEGEKACGPGVGESGCAKPPREPISYQSKRESCSCEFQVIPMVPIFARNWKWFMYLLVRSAGSRRRTALLRKQSNAATLLRWQTFAFT